MKTITASAGNSIRVLIIIENLPAPFDRRVWQEATTLTNAGYSVSIVCPTGKNHAKRFECIDNINIHRYPAPPEADSLCGYVIEYTWSLIAQFLLSLYVCFGRGFDIVHACNPPDTIFLIAAFYRVFGKRFVFDHHDINPELFEAKFGNRNRLIYRLVVCLERLSFWIADISIATNESYRQIAVNRGKMSPANVYVVRSGPNLERLKIIDPVAERKHGRRYLVGYVGVLGKQEGVHFLLEAADYIVNRRSRSDVHFTIVGGGTELPALRRLTEDLRISHHVTFTGRVPDQDLLEVLNTADVCVNPDVANEMNDKSTMNKIMEYMALGKPIVQFDLKEGRFSAQDASLYARPNDAVDMADKIVTLLDDECLRQRMGATGRERVIDRLEWRHEAPKLLAAYAAVSRLLQPEPRTIRGRGKEATPLFDVTASREN